MPDMTRTEIHLPDTAATQALGEVLANHAQTGHVFLLSGPVGAGKSELARAFIRARLGRDEDVPSPTFTLVQTYDDGANEIWHADLYRLSHPDEAIELGLTDAFDSAVSLVEWPDRLGDLIPDHAIRIDLSYSGDSRTAVLTVPALSEIATAIKAWKPA